MKFTINTNKLNNMLGKVAKGVGNGKILPATSYLELTLEEEILYITATNMSHFITINQEDVKGEDGTILIKAEQLIKLVSKTTKEEMTFTADDDKVTIEGNGKYVLELYKEEFPSYEFGNPQTIEIVTAQLKKALTTHKAAIATNFTVPCLTGYFLGAKSISTDSVKMCIGHLSIGEDKMLIPQDLADLIQVLTEEKVRVQHEDNKIMFTTGNIQILGTELDGITNYPDISGVLDFEVPHSVVIPRAELVNALDRLSIFTDKFDNNSVKLNLTDKSFTLTDGKANSSEALAYVEKSKKKFNESYTVNISFLAELAGALEGNTITLKFGNETLIRLEDTETTMILSTMDN